MTLNHYLPHNNCRFFALGRNAMYAALIAFGLNKGSEVLTPAFNCDSAIEPFIFYGLEPVFYRCNAHTFEADIHDMRRRLTSHTGLIHVINHFGFPQPWEEILKLRQESGIPVMEDNAYSLFSHYHGKPFGSFGDVSVFSLRKNLPIVNGGALCLNTTGLSVAPQGSHKKLLYAGDIRRLAVFVAGELGISTILRRVTSYIYGHSAIPPLFSEPGSGYPHVVKRDTLSDEFTHAPLRGMSLLALAQLQFYSQHRLSRVIQVKRRFYYNIVAAIQGLDGITTLWPELPDTIVPFCVNLLIDHHRDEFLREMARKYRAFAWPTLPMSVIKRLDEFPEVEILGRKLLQIPLETEQITDKRYSTHIKQLTDSLHSLHGKYFNQ
ncbi:MAG: aminotransferase class I/II-fold pyridoxal phosphate-dependent enzyme [Nitrospirae bacterium]|nr:aminotransferase class I/II-fold pyridoxal phosphate-dependent enzyme [Nitrospirota bacterium]MBF0554108.1 aminotransferase class I/II-fold pyridoxal phosphate-dependent enzyme [Nitrospirota bacterium]